MRRALSVIPVVPVAPGVYGVRSYNDPVTGCEAVRSGMRTSMRSCRAGRT